MENHHFTSQFLDYLEIPESELFSEYIFDFEKEYLSSISYKLTNIKIDLEDKYVLEASSLELNRLQRLSKEDKLTSSENIKSNILNCGKLILSKEIYRIYNGMIISNNNFSLALRNDDDEILFYNALDLEKISFIFERGLLDNIYYIDYFLSEYEKSVNKEYFSVLRINFSSCFFINLEDKIVGIPEKLSSHFRTDNTNGFKIFNLVRSNIQNDYEEKKDTSKISNRFKFAIALKDLETIDFGLKSAFLRGKLCKYLIYLMNNFGRDNSFLFNEVLEYFKFQELNNYNKKLLRHLLNENLRRHGNVYKLLDNMPSKVISLVNQKEPNALIFGILRNSYKSIEICLAEELRIQNIRFIELCSLLNMPIKMHHENILEIIKDPYRKTSYNYELYTLYLRNMYSFENLSKKEKYLRFRGAFRFYQNCLDILSEYHKQNEKEIVFFKNFDQLDNPNLLIKVKNEKVLDPFLRYVYIDNKLSEKYYLLPDSVEQAKNEFFDQKKYKQILFSEDYDIKEIQNKTILGYFRNWFTANPLKNTLIPHQIGLKTIPIIFRWIEYFKKMEGFSFSDFNYPLLLTNFKHGFTIFDYRAYLSYDDSQKDVYNALYWTRSPRKKHLERYLKNIYSTYIEDNYGIPWSRSFDLEFVTQNYKNKSRIYKETIDELYYVIRLIREAKKISFYKKENNTEVKITVTEYLNRLDTKKIIKIRETGEKINLEPDYIPQKILELRDAYLKSDFTNIFKFIKANYPTMSEYDLRTMCFLTSIKK